MSKELIAKRLNQLVAEPGIDVPVGALPNLKDALAAIRLNELSDAANFLYGAAALMEAEAISQQQYNLAREVLADGQSLALAAPSALNS